ncbi:UBX domain-containing protein 1-like [Antedon mediterranea]|uniref:UBX domain-containing protein 1-like n=1 Tax=Antedon mediterranea TaxID=105859 RepID=UPI003AF516E1
MPTDLELLTEMGFSENRSRRALATTKYKGAQVAMDWLFAHADDPDIDDPFEEAPGQKLSDEPAAEGDNKTETAEAKSVQCDECGKKLRTQNDIMMHASRTGHSGFSESTEEIKPLTEEEKKEQLAKIQERLKQKKAERIEQEKKELVQKEKLRRKQGKELVAVKEQHEMNEMKREAERKKREKLEEKKAKERVREQIARDKADRAAKFAKTAVPPPSIPAAASKPTEVQKKEYTQTKLQIRLTDGSTLTNSFEAKEPLAAVRVYIEVNRKDSKAPFSLMTPFPRKVFTDEDMTKPLHQLGLVPSAVLTLTKPQL